MWTNNIYSDFIIFYGGLSDRLSGFNVCERGFNASIQAIEYGKIATAILDSGHELHTNPPDLFHISNI